jgi:distribution and morphology protein 10
VNVYSYESDLSFGGEWFIGRKRGKRGMDAENTGMVNVPGVDRDFEERSGRSENTLREVEDIRSERELDSPFPITTDYPETSIVPFIPLTTSQTEDRDGVLKARISGNCVSFR